ncbi:hypothetical protein A0H81_10697 [Grifola frondosa]|uniref:Uncharacterized protein n=1 Tax=Grifola frondosa TaxID=5627 RepID=A0A1C7LXD5_GRIFR|nr:hypothetical protein A0H81_10697 [Grifola frondosa]
MLGAVEEGVALDNLKFSLLADLTSDDGSEATKTQLEAKRAQLKLGLEAWRVTHAQFVAPMVDEAMVDVQMACHGWSLPINFPWFSDGERGCHEDEAEEEDEDSEEDDTSVSQATVAPKKRKATAMAGRARQAKAEGWDKINVINIELPSAYSSLVLAHPSMRVLVDLERQVRQGQANDALADTRTHLITAFSFRYQRHNVSGQIQNTRAMRKIQRKQQVVGRAADTYRRARRALIALGMQVDDACYRVLKTTDVILFAMYTEEEQLGDSRKTPSWIWEDFTFMGRYRRVRSRTSWLMVSEQRFQKDVR